MASTRAYRNGKPPEFACKIIKENSGTQFNPIICKVLDEISTKHLVALFDMFEEY